MDSSTLERLARDGFAAVPGDQLTDLAVWCRDYCEASGDGRYCSVGETLRSIDDWWREHDEPGGVPTELLREIEHEVMSWLPAVLAAVTPGDGAALARTMREAVQARLLGPSDWRRDGYVDPG